jgi:hypothetical protein
MFSNIARRTAAKPQAFGLQASRVQAQVKSPLMFRPDLARMFSGFGKPISETTIGVPAETFEGEKRVALSPEAVKRLKKDGFSINIEKGAGVNAGFLDEYYTKEGASMVDNAYQSDIVFKVRPPSATELPKLEKDSGLVSMLWPRVN